MPHGYSFIYMCAQAPKLPVVWVVEYVRWLVGGGGNSTVTPVDFVT